MIKTKEELKEVMTNQTPANKQKFVETLKHFKETTEDTKTKNIIYITETLKTLKSKIDSQPKKPIKSPYKVDDVIKLVEGSIEADMLQYVKSYADILDDKLIKPPYLVDDVIRVMQERVVTELYKSLD